VPGAGLVGGAGGFAPAGGVGAMEERFHPSNPFSPDARSGPGVPVRHGAAVARGRPPPRRVEEPVARYEVGVPQ